MRPRGKLLTPSRGLVRVFAAYTRWYVRKHFHSVKLAGTPPAAPVPLVIYLNHPSWWDPLICLLIQQRFFQQAQNHAPIDAGELERFRFFKKLGFFGVEKHSRRGAAGFLRVCDEIFTEQNRILWITPHGRFVDARDRETRFQSGLVHLALRHPQLTFLPLAVEYAFWEQRLPEALVMFGDPITADTLQTCRLEDAQSALERGLQSAQNRLAELALRRDASLFTDLLTGQAGTGSTYDWWLKVRQGRGREIWGQT